MLMYYYYPSTARCNTIISIIYRAQYFAHLDFHGKEDGSRSTTVLEVKESAGVSNKHFAAAPCILGFLDVQVFKDLSWMIYANRE